MTERPPLLRKLSRSATFREKFEDAGELVQRSLEKSQEVLLDASAFMDFSANTECLERVLERVEAEGFPEEKEVAEGKEPLLERAATEPPTRSSLEAIGRSVLEPSNIVLRDKISFVLGVTNMAATAFWLGRSPSTYYKFWVAKALLLFTLRWFTYRVRGMHYMMMEFCYAANLLGAIHLFVYPRSALLRKLSFAHMAGPLTWAVVAMRNSLVFHDFDRITTLMMHVSPALTAWTMRWYPRPEWTEGMTPEELHRYTTATWFEMAILPMAFYLLWVLVYYILTFILLAQRIRTKGRENMFTYMVLREQAKKSALARVVLRAPRPLQPVVYLCIHMLMSWVVVLPTKLWWDHYWAHTALLLAILLISAANGASFYFQVFAKRYIAQVAAHNERRASRGAGLAAAGGDEKKTE